MAIAWVAGIHLDLWVPLLLACGTFTAYVGDRLLDAHRAFGSNRHGTLRERHYFHWRHRRLLIPMAACTALIAAALIALHIPVAVMDRNSAVAAAALLYFSGVHSSARLPSWLRRKISKEFLVGLLFTAGCAAPTLSSLHRVAWPLTLCLAIFTALAWLNCCAIESWESPHRLSSMRMYAGALIIIVMLASAALAFKNSRASALAFAAAASALLLFLLDRLQTRLSPLTLRALADLVLLTPAVLIILGARHA